MAAALIVTVLSAFLQGALPPPTTRECEQTATPTAVTDHRPDFRAVNPFTQASNRFRIRVSPDSDPSFASPIWISAAGPGGTTYPGGNVPGGAMSSEIPYGHGTANLTTLPLLDWGRTYRWQICMGRNNNNNTWTGWSAHSLFTMANPSSNVNLHSNNGDPNLNSWRFIGVPIAFGTTVPASELLGSGGFTILNRLDEPTRTWVQVQPTDMLEGGRGYLAWTAPNTLLSLTQGKVLHGIPPVKSGGSTTTPSYQITNLFSFTTLAAPTGQEITDGVAANEYRGNHLFANPYYARISWRSSVIGPTFGHVARSNISYAMYKWDGTQYLTYNGVTDTGNAGEWIEPFQAVGIWIQATPYTLWVDTPAPTTGGLQDTIPMAVATTPDSDHWRLMIEARSGAAIDTENAFGIDPQADDAWDVRDSEEPGAGSATWLLVSMDHRSDWTTYARKYTHDFKRTPMKAGDKLSWTFTVDGNTNLPATLTWPNLADIPAGDWKLTLEDPSTSTTIDLSSASSFDTAAVNGPQTYVLHAERLADSPSLSAGGGGGGGGGGGCGLLGLEAMLLAGWILARRASRMARR